MVDDDDPLLVCLGWAFRSVERVTLRIAVQLMGALIEYSTSGRQTDHLTLVICGPSASTACGCCRCHQATFASALLIGPVASHRAVDEFVSASSLSQPTIIRGSFRREKSLRRQLRGFSNGPHSVPCGTSGQICRLVRSLPNSLRTFTKLFDKAPLCDGWRRRHGGHGAARPGCRLAR